MPVVVLVVFLLNVPYIMRKGVFMRQFWQHTGVFKLL